jgi:hypothetical protein
MKLPFASTVISWYVGVEELVGKSLQLFQPLPVKTPLNKFFPFLIPFTSELILSAVYLISEEKS